MTDKLKKKIYDLVEAEGEHDFFDHFILTLVVLNIFAVGLETIESIKAHYYNQFFYFRYFSILIFSIEYVLRIWCCNILPEYSHPLWGRLKFAIRPIVLIDLISIFPFYFPIGKLDLRHLQMFKMLRYSHSVQDLIKIIKTQGKALLSGIILIGMLMVISGSILYYLEYPEQPKVFSSIPASMWWAIVTITTVGYGDMFPISFLGKLFAAITAICGIGLFALPAGIMGAAFLDNVKEQRAPSKFCGNCGSKHD
jgi:voltage-gated potassium channel